MVSLFDLTPGRVIPDRLDERPCRGCGRMISGKQASWQIGCCDNCYLSGNGSCADGRDHFSWTKVLYW